MLAHLFKKLTGRSESTQTVSAPLSIYGDIFSHRNRQVSVPIFAQAQAHQVAGSDSYTVAACGAIGIYKLDRIVLLGEGCSLQQALTLIHEWEPRKLNAAATMRQLQVSVPLFPFSASTVRETAIVHGIKLHNALNQGLQYIN